MDEKSNRNNNEKENLDDVIKKGLNANILKITMLINKQYPELSKYLEEMSITIPNEQNPEITLINLKAYYNSLHSLLCKYRIKKR